MDKYLLILLIEYIPTYMYGKLRLVCKDYKDSVDTKLTADNTNNFPGTEYRFAAYLSKIYPIQNGGIKNFSIIPGTKRITYKNKGIIDYYDEFILTVDNELYNNDELIDTNVVSIGFKNTYQKRDGTINCVGIDDNEWFKYSFHKNTGWLDNKVIYFDNRLQMDEDGMVVPMDVTERITYPGTVLKAIHNVALLETYSLSGETVVDLYVFKNGVFRTIHQDVVDFDYQSTTFLGYLVSGGIVKTFSLANIANIDIKNMDILPTNIVAVKFPYFYTSNGMILELSNLQVKYIYRETILANRTRQYDFVNFADIPIKQTEQVGANVKIYKQYKKISGANQWYLCYQRKEFFFMYAFNFSNGVLNHPIYEVAYDTFIQSLDGINIPSISVKFKAIDNDVNSYMIYGNSFVKVFCQEKYIGNTYNLDKITWRRPYQKVEPLGIDIRYKPQTMKEHTLGIIRLHNFRYQYVVDGVNYWFECLKYPHSSVIIEYKKEIDFPIESEDCVINYLKSCPLALQQFASRGNVIGRFSGEIIGEVDDVYIEFFWNELENACYKPVKFIENNTGKKAGDEWIHLYKMDSLCEKSNRTIIYNKKNHELMEIVKEALPNYIK